MLVRREKQECVIHLLNCDTRQGMSLVSVASGATLTDIACWKTTTDRRKRATYDRSRQWRVYRLASAVSVVIDGPARALPLIKHWVGRALRLYEPNIAVGGKTVCSTRSLASM